MCGRFALDAPLDALIETFVVTHHRFPDWAPRWNIAPTTMVPLIVDTTAETKTRIIGPARWSLTPSWSDTLETKYPTFNARSETAATKPTFRDGVKNYRGIIPASGYFEWHTEGRIKTPHYIAPTDGLFAFAALYSTWGSGANTTVTATILTMDAPAQLLAIHPRSPVALPRDSWDQWLDPAVVGDNALVQAAVAQSAEVFRSVTEHVVRPLHGDSPDLISPREDDSLLPEN